MTRKQNAPLALIVTLLLLAITQTSRAEVYFTPPKMPDGYKIDRMTWIDGTLLLYTIPCRCKKCGEIETVQFLVGDVNWEGTRLEDRKRVSGKNKAATMLRIDDTKTFPLPLKLYQRHTVDWNFVIVMLDIKMEGDGLLPLLRARYEGWHPGKPDRGAPFTTQGRTYFWGEWIDNRFHLYDMADECSHCNRGTIGFQMLAGNANRVLFKDERTGEIGRTNKPFGASAFLRNKDTSRVPDPADILIRNDNYDVVYIDTKNRDQGLNTLRREWEKVHRN